MRTPLSLLFLSITFTGVLHVNAQVNTKIQRLQSHVEFDGIPDEEAWNGIDYFPLTMNRPNFGLEPSERSEVMIAYDDQFLWVGARLFMNDATKIVATIKKRDETGRSSDSFGIIIDTYNDNENAFAFFTMPTGARTDYAISNDAAMSGGGGSGGGGSAGGGGGGGSSSFRGGNMRWNTFWDVKTTRDCNGW